MKQRLLFAGIMGMITTVVISFVIIAMNLGFNSQFVIVWLRSWMVSYILAVTSMLVIAPKVQELVNNLTDKS